MPVPTPTSPPRTGLPDGRVVLVGGGLANGLIAYRLLESRPELDLLLIERGPTLGGNHVWCFHDGDLTADQHAWMQPFVARSWPTQEVRFPDHHRRLDSGYHAVTSEKFHDVLSSALGDRARLGLEVAEVSPHAVTLVGGKTIRARAVIDGRGPDGGRALDLAWQKFLGLTLHLAEPHHLAGPVIMDATVPQRDGYRFLYTLPFDERTILVEDTRYSDGPALDREEMRAEIRRYADAQGFAVERIGREEEGVLPIVLAGDLGRFWGTSGVPRSGLRAALFHPTTGYSLPEAVRLADDLASPGTSWRSEDLHRRIRERSAALWRRGAFFRLLNRMLFRAAEPEQRWRIFQRFYRLRAPLIGRFYAGRPTLGDRLRILAGKPPVPVHRALRCLGDTPSDPVSSGAPGRQA